MPRLRPVQEQPPPKEPGLFQSPEPELETNSIKLTDAQTDVTTLAPKESAVVVDKTPEPDEATLALQKQLADLKKSEEVQRELHRRVAQERDEAMRREQSHAAQLEELRKTNFEQEELAVGSALAAAKAESDKALLDYKNALDAGDTSAQAEAMDKLTDAKANLRLLERGKEEIEQRKKEPPKPVEQPRSQAGDPIDGFNLPNGEKDWLRGHRDYLTDPRKVSALRYADEQASLEGLRPGHSGYLPHIEGTLRSIGSMPRVEEPVDEPVRETDQRASIVSAPVSRETPTGGTGQRTSSTKIRLTAEEAEYAKIAGITDVEYARQKQKLNQHKANGDYGERR